MIIDKIIEKPTVEVEEGKRVLKLEADAIMQAAERLNGDFSKAVELIQACQGKVVISGIGKSGHIARKIASTMSSTGTSAVFLHPAESSHGDMGVLSAGDLLIVISNGGESPELADMLTYAARKNIPLIAMTGKKESTLGKAAKLIIDISVKEEACPLKLAPTSSSTVTLALGDALAMAVLKKRGFRREDFAELHPGGSLGRKLTLRVRDVMHKGDALPLVQPSEPFHRVISIMAAKEVRGAAGVIDDQGRLIGIITDGNIRRRLEKSQDPLHEKAEEIMSLSPKTIDADELAEKALFVMQEFKINLLFVVDRHSDTAQKPIGILHLHDLLAAQIR